MTLEFALILPVFIMLVFGVVTAGLAYNDKLSVANAVRESARFGSTIDFTTGPPSYAADQGWADAVQQRVQQTYLNGASSLPLDDICVVLEDSTGATLDTPSTQGTSCGTEPTSPGSVPVGDCVVKVWVQKPGHISLLVLPDFNFNIGADSVSYYGRQVGACPGA